jgi:hypothetical protein
VPQRIPLRSDGSVCEDGRAFWFLPGKFAFCPCCHAQPTAGMRERTKLAGLSSEGRSSATTLIASSMIDWMNRAESGVPMEKRKLLAFTDNRGVRLSLMFELQTERLSHFVRQWREKVRHDTALKLVPRFALHRTRLTPRRSDRTSARPR